MSLSGIGPAWDRINIGGVPFTGLAQVEKAERARKVDKPKSPGADGVRLRIKGREAAEPEITLTGWTDEHLDQMRRIAAIACPIERGDRHNAVRVAHPKLAFHDIIEVFVHKVTGPDVQESRSFVMKLECIEWRPPPPRNATRRPAAPTPPAIAFTGVERAPVASYPTPPVSRAPASTPAASVPRGFSSPPSSRVGPVSRDPFDITE